MCVWSAYAGQSGAAPLLWKSLRKIEGIWGGFYTGLATLDRGRFRLGKCEGSTDCWREKYDLEEFTGNAGLIHSRTDSGGDWHFAHPFVACHGRVAAVSQGSGTNGRFAELVPRYGTVGDWLIGQGYSFPGAVEGGTSNYNFRLSDGRRVPMAEITVTLVEYYYEQTGDPVLAMKKTAQELMEESATVFLFADRPGEIGFININQHVVCFREDDSVMLSITSLGLPGAGMEIPGNTVGLLSAEACRMERIADAFAVEPFVPQGGKAAAVEYLRRHPGAGLSTLVDRVLGPRFQKTDRLALRAVAGYRMLESLADEDLIRFEEDESPGMTGAPGRTFRIFLKD